MDNIKNLYFKYKQKGGIYLEFTINLYLIQTG